ncbi:hypothetical protein M5K25_018175 [Dendrobium thyrsiflorum]|uniref:Protein kinase domain-containing protein n=1 Tax=Dendrobium thyrsiflorum TaxID=117978 RepID=A0ABD0UHK1_DENTH
MMRALAILFCIWIWTPSTVYGDTDGDDVSALNVFYTSVNSPNQLTGWNESGGDPCGQSWKGVKCSGSSVTELKLSGLGLNGNLGYQMDKLKSLVELDVSNNNLGGGDSIPYNLPQNLQQLNLAQNQFNGGIPYSISQMASLQKLNLAHNQLRGALSDMFGQLPNLEVMDLSSNFITGDIPESFSSLSSLTTLFLQNNQFTGPIDVLANLPLNDLNVANNRFTGWIPNRLKGINNLKTDGNSWNSGPAPPPPPYTSPPGIPSNPGQGSGGNNSPSVGGGKSSGIGGGGIAGIIISILVVGAIIAFFLLRRKSRRFSREDHFEQDQPFASLASNELKSIHIASAVDTAKFKSATDETTFQPTSASLKPPPTDRQNRSYDEDEFSKSLPVKKAKAVLIRKTMYSVADLQVATNSFSVDNLIGAGSLGRVYRAQFTDGKVLAVKKIYSSSLPRQSYEGFIELVSTISQLYHPNISELVGYCCEHGQHLLVYDFYKNGSLQDLLHLVDEDSNPLSWNTRVKIALGSARALEMDLRNTPFTVQLGRGASIQLANATINTGNSGATIQFGELQFSLATASAAAVPVYGMDTEGPAGRPYAADVAARHVHPPPRRSQPAQVVNANEFPQRRVSVFKRLSNSETPATRRVMDGKQISVLPATTTTLPTGLSMPGRNDAEASSSGGRPSRRQRRRMNAELRAQQLLQVHPSTLPAQEPEASVPTQNKFTNLKWVKRNSSTGELKQSFWEQRPQAPVPQKKKEPETLSGRVHRVLKTVKEKGLMKKKYQRPLMIEARRTPSRELPSLVTRGKFKQNLQEAHQGVTLGPRVQESAAERAQQKDKQIWRPRSHERKALGRQTNMGVTSGAASQRSGPTDKSRKKWIPKKVPFDNPLDGRHPGESSRGSHHQPTASSQEEASFDRSPRIEEFFMLGDEPEIQWKRRSGIRKREDDENDEETMRVEVVYMVEHDDEPPLLRVYRRQHGAGSTAGRDEDSSENEEEEEFEDNHLFADATTLEEAQRQMHRQMKAKDKEIAHLNAKMTEMMTQMTMMMQMMQRNITANPIPVQQTNHQATSSGLANPPAHPVPQVSGVRVTSSSIPPTQEGRAEMKQTQKEQWEIAVSKKTTKMLKQLEGVPGVKWKSPTEPVLDLKALPIAQTSTFKQRPNQAGSSKSGKEKPSKRKTKLKKFKEKRTATQRAIDCLDEYYQTVRRPIKLADFMSELKVAEAEEANEEPLPVETCRVISVTPVAPIKDKYVNELVVEICLATSSMDYSSEEDLYFPREVESEHDITSQMEHVQLEGDSELEDAKYFIPKKQKPSSSLEAKASSSKAAKRPGQEGEKKQVWRKKATPTLPKTVVIPKERKKVPHLGSDTEEEDVTPTKSQKVCQSTAKKKKKIECSDSDYDYESTYASTVQCVFSRSIGSLSISDSVFVVTRIPMQHFKEIAPREVYNVEELITFMCPLTEKGAGQEAYFIKLENARKK